MSIEAPQPVAPPSPKRPSPLPWIIAGSAVLLLVVVGGGVAVAIAVPAAVRAQEEKAVADVIFAFDQAWEDGDCGLYEDVTDEDFRDGERPDGFDCGDWQDLTEGSFDEDGNYTYEIEIDDISVNGDRARATTQESWEFEGEDVEHEIEYKFEKQHGAWVITDWLDTEAD